MEIAPTLHILPLLDLAPGGPDLAYDPERQQIDQAFDSAVSIDASGIVEDREVDWRAIIDKIWIQAEHTRDLWLPVYLCRAGAAAGRMDIVALGAQYLAGLLENCWAVMHPSLEDYGFQGRKGACDTLASNAEMLLPMERLPVLTHPRHGVFTCKDMMRFHHEGSAAEGWGMFRMVLDEIGETELRATAAHLDLLQDGMARVDAVLSAQAGADTSPNFKPLFTMLVDIREGIRAFLLDDEPEASHEAETVDAIPDLAALRVSGEIRDRDDVLRHLDQINRYYRQHEPSSPVPLLLERARKWVALDFVSILEDIIPGSADDAARLLRSRLE